METVVVLSGAGIILGIAVVILFFVVYFCPTIIGIARQHKETGAIFAINLLLGWTFIFWALCLGWSMTSNVKEGLNK